MFKTNELDINYFVELAKSHVGEIHDLEFQTHSKRGEAAGKYEILSFTEENPHFTMHYFRNKGDDTPDGADLGYYTIRITESKFYNGKVIRVPVQAYVQAKDRINLADGEYHITKALFINNVNLDTGKSLKAYEFGIIDWNIFA